MKEKLIIFLLVFSLTVNGAALITMGYFWGRDYRSGEYDSRGGEPPRLGRELSLDNGQQGKMQGLRRSLLREIDPIQDELMTKREELVNLLIIEEPDRSAIDKKLSEINGLQSQIQHTVIDHLLREKGFLTPRQQKQYFDLISKRLCRERFPMGRGQGRGMGMRDGSGRGREQGQGMGRWDGSRKGRGQGNRMRW